jgi:outer membrane protein assembly factor BamB
MARDGDLRKAHSTPLIVTVDGKPLMLSGGAKAAYGYDPRTGKELWRVQCPAAWSVAPRPLYQEGLALFVSGLGKTELLAIRVGGTGDVTDSAIVWRTETAVSKTASPILVDGRFYMVSDDGMVTCLEPATGKEFWHSRIPGSYAASPIYNEGRIYFFNSRAKGQL